MKFFYHGIELSPLLITLYAIMSKGTVPCRYSITPWHWYILYSTSLHHHPCSQTMFISSSIHNYSSQVWPAQQECRIGAQVKDGSWGCDTLSLNLMLCLSFVNLRGWRVCRLELILKVLRWQIDLGRGNCQDKVVERAKCKKANTKVLHTFSKLQLLRSDIVCIFSTSSIKTGPFCIWVE